MGFEDQSATDSLWMPPEWAPHARMWMAFPPNASYLCINPERADISRRAWASVAHAIADYEPVTMVVEPPEIDIARSYLDERITLEPRALDDAWMRDIGPTYVSDSFRQWHAVNWVFNGWGAQEWAKWASDSRVASHVAAVSGHQVVESALVNEGGAFHVDGQGTALVTETVQLDPGRNPGWTKADVEAELHRTLGVTKVIWVSRGLTRDSASLGTRGHIDMVATFCAPGTVLVHSQTNLEHPDYEISQEVIATLHAARDARGRSLEVIEVPAPATLSDDEGFVDYSYINHVLVNGAVVACGFADDHDEAAAEILAQAYPGREVRMLDAREILAAGGGIHCITQQQPSADVRREDFA